MRRLLTLAAFLLVISLIPVCAQRGARGSAGGSHGGFSGSHGGFAGHSGVGARPMGGGFGGSHAGFGSGSHFGQHNRLRGSLRGSRGFRNRCFNCFGYGYPFYDAYYGYYDPNWWWDSYSSYNEDDERERALASQMNAENLQEQRELREQDQDSYARPMARRDVPARDERAQSERRDDPATVLVFRDQHQREVQNYAIVGQMLWNFTPQRTEKIPLADLDIAATTKANDDRGVDFHLPRTGEGQ